MKFRNDISFLRALSVVAVLLYHFKFSFFKGGFIGVDIFFVISGYLMTRIILTGLSNNNFSLLDFYQKRVVRIFPALLIMIAFFAVLIYCCIPTQLISYAKQGFSSSLFFSNIAYYYWGAGYFRGSQQFNFLLHTWSLSVEWQFYMVYPVILLLFRKTYVNNRKRFNSFFIVIIFLSVALMVLHYLFNKTYSFYMLDSRAWEMMSGGLAFLFKDLFREKSIQVKKRLFYISFSILVSFFLFADEHSVRWWPFVTTILPVGCTALILLLQLELKIFSNKIIKYTGDISYSLYLWHWPLYVFSLFLGWNESLKNRIIFIALAVFFAIISYHSIEKRGYKNYKLVLGGAAILFSIFYSISKLAPGYLFDKKTAQLVNTAVYYKDSKELQQQFSRGNKHLADIQPFREYNVDALRIDPGKKNIILLGDSHAGMFSQTINNIFDKSKYHLIQVTGDATYPMMNAEEGYSGPKELFNYFFKEYFPENYQKVDLVIIGANYFEYYKEDLVKKIDFNENYFKKYNIPVVYLGQTENYGIDFPTHFYLKNRFNTKTANYPRLKDKVGLTNQYLMDRLGDRYISLLDCKITKINKEGIPYMYDMNHLTYYGAQQYQNFIMKSLPLQK